MLLDDDISAATAKYNETHASSRNPHPTHPNPPGSASTSTHPNPTSLVSAEDLRRGNEAGGGAYGTGGGREGLERRAGRDGHASGARLSLDGDTSLGEAIQRCLEVYYHIFRWDVPFPEHPGVPLLYIPQEVQQLQRDPDCLGVMESEVNMLSDGLLEQIPLGYYPIQVEELQRGLDAATSTQANIRRMQERLFASGQLERVTWKPEEVNPSLDAEDIELLDTDIDQSILSQRETPSLAHSIQRPVYTEAGGESSTQRHVERLLRLQPEPVRRYLAAAAAAAAGGKKDVGHDGLPPPLLPNGLPGGGGPDFSLLRSSPSPSPAPYRGGSGGAGSVGLQALEAAAGADADELARQWLTRKKEAWEAEVKQSFRAARLLESQFTDFIDYLTEKKFGLDPKNASHIQLSVALWKAFGDMSQMPHDVTQHALAWGRLCAFSYAYAGPSTPVAATASFSTRSTTTASPSPECPPPALGDASPSSVESEWSSSLPPLRSTSWMAYFRDVKLPLRLTVWGPLMRRYTAALEAYIRAGGPPDNGTSADGERRGANGGDGKKGKGVEEGTHVDESAAPVSHKTSLPSSSSSFSTSHSLSEALARRKARLHITTEELDLAKNGGGGLAPPPPPHTPPSGRTENPEKAPYNASTRSGTEEENPPHTPTTTAHHRSSNDGEDGGPTSGSGRQDSGVASAVAPSLEIGKSLQRQSGRIFYRSQGVPIYPMSVTPVFPSGFEVAAATLRAYHQRVSQGKQAERDGAPPQGSSRDHPPPASSSSSSPPLSPSSIPIAYPDLDFLGEDASGLAHLVLPGASIPEAQCAVKGPHVLVHDRTLLCADKESVEDLAKCTTRRPSSSSAAARPVVVPAGSARTDDDSAETQRKPHSRSEEEEEEDGAAAAASLDVDSGGELLENSSLLYHALPENTFDALDIDNDNTSSYLFHFFSAPSICHDGAMGKRRKPDEEEEEEGRRGGGEEEGESWKDGSTPSFSEAPSGKAMSGPSADHEANGEGTLEGRSGSDGRAKQLPTRHEFRQRYHRGIEDLFSSSSPGLHEENPSTTTTVAYHPIFFPSAETDGTDPSRHVGTAAVASASSFSSGSGGAAKHTPPPPRTSGASRGGGALLTAEAVTDAAKRGVVGLDGSLLTYSRIGLLRKYQKAVRAETLPLPRHYAILFASEIENDDVEEGEEEEEDEKKPSHTHEEMQRYGNAHGRDTEGMQDSGAKEEPRVVGGMGEEIQVKKEPRIEEDVARHAAHLGNIGVKRERSEGEEEHMVARARV